MLPSYIGNRSKFNLIQRMLLQIVADESMHEGNNTEKRKSILGGQIRNNPKSGESALYKMTLSQSELLHL